MVSEDCSCNPFAFPPSIVVRTRHGQRLETDSLSVYVRIDDAEMPSIRLAGRQGGAYSKAGQRLGNQSLVDHLPGFGGKQLVNGLSG